MIWVLLYLIIGVVLDILTLNVIDEEPDISLYVVLGLLWPLCILVSIITGINERRINK